MGKSLYLTARCPTGCETWLYPAAVEPHIDLGRCRGHAWVDEIPDATLVAAPIAELLEPVIPAALVARPNLSYERLISTDWPEYLRVDVCAGITVRSPVKDVSSRRWVHVATAAARRDGAAGVQRAMTAAGFAELEDEIIDPTEFVECPDCREFVKRKGLHTHRLRNTACRWRRAAAEVRDVWQRGWRDPYSVLGAPLKWAELGATAEWRRRLRTVAFPRWTAVLLAPPASDETSLLSGTSGACPG